MIIHLTRLSSLCVRLLLPLGWSLSFSPAAGATAARGQEEPVQDCMTKENAKRKIIKKHSSGMIVSLIAVLLNLVSPSACLFLLPQPPVVCEANPVFPPPRTCVANCQHGFVVCLKSSSPVLLLVQGLMHQVHPNRPQWGPHRGCRWSGRLWRSSCPLLSSSAGPRTWSGRARERGKWQRERLWSMPSLLSSSLTGCPKLTLLCNIQPTGSVQSGFQDATET